MPIDRTEKLKNILELLKTDTVSPSDIEKFLGLLINAIKTAKTNFDNLSAENLQQIKSFLAYAQAENQQTLKKIDDKSSKLESSLQAKIALVERLLTDIRDNPPVDGKDGVDGKNPDPSEVVPLVLKQLPPVVLDSGEIIVEKINDLEIVPEKQIDYKHIKNIPKQDSTRVIGGYRPLAFYDETTLITEYPTKIKFQGGGVSLALDSEGSIIVTVAGGAAATEVYEQATNSGDNLVFTISNTPNANTLLVFNSNTGQIYTPTTDYVTTGTTITFGSAQENVTIMAKYSY